MVLAIDHRANDGAQAAAFLRGRSRPGSRPSARRRRSTRSGWPPRHMAPHRHHRRRRLHRLAHRAPPLRAWRRGRGHRPRSGQGRHLARPRCPARGGRPQRRGRDPPGRGRRGRRHPCRRRLPHRHPGVASDRRCTTPMSRPPNGSSMRPSPRASGGSSTSRRSTSSATRRASPATRPSAATRPTVSSVTTTRRSTWPTVAAEKRIAAGAPVVIVMPGTTYGPGDHSAPGAQLKAAFDGTLRYLAMTSPRDLAGPRRRPRRRDRRRARPRPARPVLRDVRGTNMRLGEAMAIAATAGGRPAPAAGDPERRAPTGARGSCRPAGRRLGVPAEPARVVSASDGVTYWAKPREGDRRARLRAARPGDRRARRLRGCLRSRRDCDVHSGDGARPPDVHPGRWR